MSLEEKALNKSWPPKGNQAKTTEEKFSILINLQKKLRSIATVLYFQNDAAVRGDVPFGNLWPGLLQLDTNLVNRI